MIFILYLKGIKFFQLVYSPVFVFFLYTEEMNDCFFRCTMHIHMCNSLSSKKKQSFISSVYRKKTNTGLYTNWKNFIPFKYKINIIKCLIDRSYKICNSYQKIHKDFPKVTTLSLNNGYPRGIIDRHIKTLSQ